MDSGNIGDDGGMAKLKTVLPLMAKFGYTAIGMGLSEARVGAEFYAKAAESKLTVVDTSPTADKSTVPYLLKDVGGVKVGIMAFNSPVPGATVDDMEERKMRFIVLRELRPKCDVLILLDQAGVATREWLDRNGARMGAPDIVVRGMNTSSIPDAQEEVIARTHVMPPLIQGKHIGVVDLEVIPGQEPKVAFNKVELDPKYAEDEQVSLTVRTANAVWANATVQHATAAMSPQAIHYSVMLCKACHQKQYAQWTQTKHAIALKTLVNKQSTTPDCLPCHSEDYRVKKQYFPDPADFAGVDCQTCHKTSLPHGMERKNYQARAVVDRKLCLECHTPDRSPSYDDKTYFPKVVHLTDTQGTTVANTSKP